MFFVPLTPSLMAFAIASFFFFNSLSDKSHNAMGRLVQHQAQYTEHSLAERRNDLASILRSFSAEELSDPESCTSPSEVHAAAPFCLHCFRRLAPRESS